MRDSDKKFSKLINKASRKASSLKEDGLASIAKLQNRYFCIGITGLSKSGKSTFITSLINQLMHHENASLAGFPPVLSERLLGVKMHPLADADIPVFPYEKNYQSLTQAQAKWPESTTDISGCLLELRLSRTGRRLNPLKAEQFSLFLEIRDYPGEWLLDLPLREMSFTRWSEQCQAQYQESPRRELMGPLFDELMQLDPLSIVDDAVLMSLKTKYVQFLHDCKYKSSSLSLIQPGRFLLPGTVEDSELLNFVPLLASQQYSEDELNNAPDGSYYKCCQRNYQGYVKYLVEPFYKTFFSRIDRQLVLVDVVNTLNAGPEYLDDMRQALTNITESFAYGSQNRLVQLFKPKIDKVVFAATKIDQVLSEDHDAVRQLLGVIVKQAYKSAQHEGVQPVCEATAAVRSSKEIKHQGDRGIAGCGVNGEPIGYIHPTIPTRIPEGEQWQPFLDWQIPLLNPPQGLSFSNQDVLPHIRLDSILNELIGDKCL
ncbi:YcjX family protein [Moritella sp. 24]|uniref:YcjX family protein n=1 Tax=Moritella sp. 24 TaxID=2746230 RepID=UPI0021031E93|nr:YcjX family protein [Moritella sp. 24]